MKLKKTGWALLALLVSGATALSANTKDRGGSDPARLGEFVSRIDDLRRDKQIPGLSYAIVRDGQILTVGGLGYADKESKRPATAETPYNIASVTKPLAATVAMRLVEAGRLDLDRPVAEYSEWQGFCESFSQVNSIFARNLDCSASGHTLRHLLSHTGEGKPGTAFSYNPVVYSWGSRPLMEVTGESFSDLVAEHVFRPADMQQSARIHRALPLREDLAERFALPHRLNDAGQMERGPRPPAQGDGAGGGVIATVLDLAKFDIAFDAGKLVSAESRASMMTSTPLNNGEPAPYGIGWFVQDYENHKLVWHSGWWDHAWSALYLKVPEQNLTFIILANSEGIYWGNPLDDARVDQSDFAQAFLQTFVL